MMRIINDVKQYKICVAFGDQNVSISNADIVMYGFIFSSSCQFKVSLMSSTHEAIMTVFTTDSNKTLEIKFPQPVLLKGAYFCIHNMSQHYADCYLTAFTEDPKKVYDMLFSKDLEETLTR